MKLSHVCIVTDDLNRLSRFYQKVLKIEPRVFRGEYVEFPTPGATLSLYRLASHEELAPGTMEAALNHSVELEFEVADVDAEYVRLKKEQIDWVMPPRDLPWGYRSFYFRDPDGNLLNFYRVIRE